ncbi:MAG TPA: single-stranded-DNA-specific exonuclease RecJ [Stellaceae bacterium]|nr:single-stranded-DNA-specific exonuclease RecJ [Stellaceae bacterium]
MSLEASAISAVLGVERSLSGRRWRARGGDDRTGLALAQRFGWPEIIGRLLAARGVGAEDAERFLDPTIRSALPDPSHLKDMDKAVARLVDAVGQGELIGIFGDYDVDGATSSALLQRFFRAVGGKSTLYIPDRQREGYGPNAAALARLKERGARVVITVDCGIAAQEALSAAAESGLDVIVVDHHLGDPALPRAHAVIDPNRVDEESPHGMMAAVGVTFLLVAGVNRALRQAGWYRERDEPDLMQWLDLVALGTVCDVVPLTGVNRALVAQGLKVMRRRGNIGLAALGDVARIGEKLDAYHAGFILGPRVNAGGRVGEADLGARLLATEDADEARALAAHLHALNADRREIEAQVLAQAVASVERDPGGALVFAAGEGWHSGVIGIVASRLRERYNRPACVVALAGGLGRGSGRSVPGLALGPIVIAAHQAGLLVNGGGHAMAAGFTVEEAKLGGLREFLEARIAASLGAAAALPELNIDGALAVNAATPGLTALIERIGPFGTANSEPRFAIPNLRVVKADIVGIEHVRCVFGDGGGSARLKAIAFRALNGERDNAMGRALLSAQGAGFHIAGHLRADNWQGREGVQLMIDDAAPVTASR